MGVMAGDQVADLIKRLHGGPLQAFFAGLIALELDDDSRDERLGVILGDGVAELQAIIGEIRDSPMAVFESATAALAATIDRAEVANSDSSRLEAYHQISQQLNNLGVVAAR